MGWENFNPVEAIFGGIQPALQSWQRREDASSIERNNQANRDAVAAANAATERLSREFAQSGVSWRVEDARRAGIHPLFALGMQSPSAPTVMAGTSDPVPSEGSLTAQWGQDLTRALMSTQTGAQRELMALQVASLKMDVEGKALDNQMRLRTLSQLGTQGPSFPGSDNFIPGQGNSGLMRVKPSERTSTQPGRYAQEAGWVPDVGYARTDTGLAPIPSKDVKERIEDQFIPETMWAIRNQLAPNITGGGAPPKSQLPRGYDYWRWSFQKQEWQPTKNKDRSLGEKVFNTLGW